MVVTGRGDGTAVRCPCLVVMSCVESIVSLTGDILAGGAGGGLSLEGAHYWAMLSQLCLCRRGHQWHLLFESGSGSGGGSGFGCVVFL